MVRIGIVGMGRMGGYHAKVCSNISGVELIGVADVNQKNLKQLKLGKTRKTTDFNDWIDDVDGVIISVPTSSHFSIAHKCLSLGKHILLEKPITKSLSEAEKLFELAATKNLVLHSGHVERFNGAVQELRKIINEPYLIEAHRMGQFSPRVKDDTVILDLMIHDLDIILSLVNSKIKKMNVLGNIIKSNFTDLAVVQLEFENGVLANLTSSRISHIKKRTMSVHQKNSFVLLDFSSQDIIVHHNTSSSVKIGQDDLKYKQEGVVERLFVYKDNPLKLEVENFAKSIRTGKNKFDAKKDLESLHLTLKIENELEKNYDRSCSGNWKSANLCL
jgi:predicted dehydrogenase